VIGTQSNILLKKLAIRRTQIYRQLKKKGKAIPVPGHGGP
jgi:hypothetical protein